MKKVTPMIHVADVEKTAKWYESIGFEIVATNLDCDEMNWARIGCGDNSFMLSAGGTTSSADRREVDLYVNTEKIDELFAQLKDRVEIIEPIHETFYGMREFVIRDVNRFWITFGESLTNEKHETETSV